MKYIRTAIATVVAGTAAATIGFASASVLTVDAGTIQHGLSGVTDDNGVKANWQLETDDNSVAKVRISGIDAAMAGKEMSVKVQGVHTDKQKVVGTLTGAESQTFTLPTGTTADQITGIEIWIEG